MKQVQRYGWIRDSFDQRDRTLGVAQRVALPLSADLRSKCPPVYDQETLGSCTANAIAAAVDFERAAQGEPFMHPSRLFIYYNERAMEGTIIADSGAEIRDGIKSVFAQGVCPESEWPYDVSKFSEKPLLPCYADALKSKALQYSRVTQNAYYVRHCLGILQKPVLFGFAVYESFESEAVAQSGIVPLPGPAEAPIGGHAVMAVGYVDATRRFLVRNSWGSGWGQAGYFEMPYDYLLDPNRANDFWVILKEQ